MKAEEPGFWIAPDVQSAPPLAASWHLPADGRPPAAAALLCNAFAEERKGCQKPLVDLARRLASAGVAVLRFDYSGCGDSPGVFGTGGVAAWRADCLRAARALASAFPGLPRLWAGVRGGAVLALSAAAVADDAAAPDAFLLWEPADGASFLRQAMQRAQVNAMVARGKSQASRASREAAWGEGRAVDLDGYLFPAVLADSLRSLLPGKTSRPGFLLRLGPDPRPAAAILSGSPCLEERVLRIPPFWNTVGQVDTAALLDASLDAVRSWLERAGSRPPVPSRPAAASAPFAPGALATRTVTGEGTVLEHVCLEVPPQDAGGRTAGASLPAAAASGGDAPPDRPQDAVRGILHLPARENGAPLSGAALMLHGWSGDRTGPHALFTAAARELAARGIACLRIDFGGRGASDGEASEASIARMAGEARAALSFLRERAGTGPDGKPVPLDVIALCSGCKVAITLAAGEPDVGRLVLWSAESMGGLRSGATGWRKTRAALGAYLRKLGRLETWKKILRREVKAGMVGKALTAHETRSPEEARREDATLRRFRGFAGRILFVYGGSDPDAPGSSKAYGDFCARNRLRADFRLIPDAGHSYYAADWQEELLAATISWLGV